MIKLSGSSISSFQWPVPNIAVSEGYASAEVIYPFEVASDGSTLYCKQYSTTLPAANTHRKISHLVTGLTRQLVYHLSGFARDTNNNQAYPLPFAAPAAGYSIQLYFDFSVSVNSIVLFTGVNTWTGADAFIRLIYDK